MHRLAILIIVLAPLLGACAPGSDGAAMAVEDYLRALAAKDTARLSALSCADWEQAALTELDSFQAVDVRLEDASCAKSGSDGVLTLVSCQGSMVATYGEEDQELDLSARTYEVIEQGGQWLMCGER
jgi:hypothetical protein